MPTATTTITTTKTNMDLAMPLSLDMFVDELVDFAVGLPTTDDFAFSLFHESDSEEQVLALDKPMVDEPVAATSTDVTFVEKTYYMINTCASHLACWNATGTGFLVVDADKFAHEVLPDYFKHRNMNSFVCELTLHGFRKTALSNKKLGLECYEFRHPYFLRGNVELLSKIERRAVAVPPLPVMAAEPAPATANEDADIEDCEESDDVSNAVGDLKQEISELQSEVHQTQQLFDKLLTSLVQQMSPPQPQQPIQQFVGYPSHHTSMYTMAQIPQSMYTGFNAAVPLNTMNYYAMPEACIMAPTSVPVENNLMDLFATLQY